ncbi:hypothetical protein UT300005_12410 [Clostridium sp. CTA-5]
MNKKIRTKDCTPILIIFLFISIIINIYSYLNINKYKYQLGKESQINIEDIRQRNESNMNILNVSIGQGCIKNEDLLKLYKNYDIITSEIIELWGQYASYKDNTFSMFSKKIDTKKVLENDVYVRMKDYLSIILNQTMKSKDLGLTLSPEYIENFKTMSELTEKVNDYFEEFNSEKLLNVTGEKREKEIIKNHYWIDMLEGIYNINNDYTNIEFNVDDSKNVNNIEIMNETE